MLLLTISTADWLPRRPHQKSVPRTARAPKGVFSGHHAKGRDASAHGELAAAPLRVEDIAVDHQTGIFSKCDCRLVLEGHLHARLGSGAEFVTHLHKGTDDGGGSADLRLIFDLGNHSH